MKLTRTIKIIAFSSALSIVGALSLSAQKDGLQSWSFQSIFGTFNRAELQRGFQVYEQVCASCHSLKHLSYRHLASLGFSENKIKAIAAKATVKDGYDDEGNPVERKGRPSDPFAKPFPNDKAARAANNGALPPDLSLIVKARADGENYLYSLLTGYAEAPQNFSLAPGMYYNRVYSGKQIAMAPPLSDGLVAYSDGTPSSVQQMAHDVTAFLAWAAEPELEHRRHMGIVVMLYLIFFTGLMYAVMRKTWKSLK